MGQPIKLQIGPDNDPSNPPALALMSDAVYRGNSAMITAHGANATLLSCMSNGTHEHGKPVHSVAA